MTPPSVTPASGLDVQAVKPVAQVVTQREASQVCPGAQPTPQAPQFIGSRRMSAQYARPPLVQVVRSSAHEVVHIPLEQTSPAAH